MKKIVVLIGILLITNFFILPVGSTISKTQDYTHNEFPESHIIENVPYISQETSFYCLFACPTMAIKSYQIDTTLQELIYNSGVGYSMIYSPPPYKRVPMGGNGGAWWKLDRCFLADLYGLYYGESRISTDSNNEEYWNIFLDKLKENISNNHPVVLKIDPLFLPSFRNPICKELGIKNHDFYDKLLRLIPSGFFHVILAVGYDETNSTILYHDAMSAVSDYPNEGIYASISMDVFKIAIMRVARYSFLSLGVFTDPVADPLNKTEIFTIAHARNIEKMKGNKSVYDKNLAITEPGYYGINALKELKNDLTGLKNQISTILVYRLTNLFHLNPFYNKIFALSNIFIPNVYSMEDWQSFANYYHQLSVEKHNISQYLHDKSLEFNDSELVNLCKYESGLLNQESENWKVLGGYFNKFMKRGIFISMPASLLLINRMKGVVEEIIQIQEQIIAGPSEQ